MKSYIKEQRIDIVDGKEIVRQVIDFKGFLHYKMLKERSPMKAISYRALLGCVIINENRKKGIKTA